MRHGAPSSLRFDKRHYFPPLRHRSRVRCRQRVVTSHRDPNSLDGAIAKTVYILSWGRQLRSSAVQVTTAIPDAQHQ